MKTVYPLNSYMDMLLGAIYQNKLFLSNENKFDGEIYGKQCLIKFFIQMNS